MSTALVRPGDITDAIDSADLLDTLLTKNLETIVDKRTSRLRKDWVSRQRKDIKETYRIKAARAYEKMWAECSNTKLGHDYIRIDANGYSVESCSICSFHYAKVGDYNDNGASKRAKSMNDDLIQNLTDRMIELDHEAGILIWPTQDDAPAHLRIGTKQPITKRWFR